MTVDDHAAILDGLTQRDPERQRVTAWLEFFASTGRLPRSAS